MIDIFIFRWLFVNFDFLKPHNFHTKTVAIYPRPFMSFSIPCFLIPFVYNYSVINSFPFKVKKLRILAFLTLLGFIQLSFLVCLVFTFNFTTQVLYFCFLQSIVEHLKINRVFVYLILNFILLNFSYQFQIFSVTCLKFKNPLLNFHS